MEAVQSPTVLSVNAQTIPRMKSSTGHRRLLNCTTLTHAARTGSSASPDRPAGLEYMGFFRHHVLPIFVISTTRNGKYVNLWSSRTACPAGERQPASLSRCIRLIQDKCACSGDHLRCSSAQRRLHPTCPLCALCAYILSWTDLQRVSWHSLSFSSEYCGLTEDLLRLHGDLLSLRLCCAWENTHVD